MSVYYVILSLQDNIENSSCAVYKTTQGKCPILSSDTLYYKLYCIDRGVCLKKAFACSFIEAHKEKYRSFSIL